ncbi:PDZ domain-containing protein [Candidatus Peregrinibacteria bacterium]|nr:PDZ domain-containing protein [Candidatus Peregrinibacteria bacterium]
MYKNQKQSKVSTPIVLIIVFIFGWKSSQWYEEPKTGNLKQETVQTTDQVPARAESSESTNLDILFEVWNLVKEKYVDSAVFDDKEQIYGASRGLVDSLNDPYTVFMTPTESKEFNDSLEGKLEGIGAELTVEDRNLIIVSPIKGSPAEKAGLKPGDIIYKIGEDVASEMNFFEAIMKIRGERGTKVELTIVREKLPEPFSVTIIRDSIDVSSVSLEKKDGNIMYLSISQFSDNTKKEFEKAVSEILLEKPKGIILDLRYNGGGYLYSAVDILGELIEGKKKAVIVKHNEKEKGETLYADGGGRLAKIPLVVLVNEGSASASEIVAGAIQDYKRGLLVGEQTFGKGSVQDVQTLSDESSLRVTVAKWFTPLERTIDHVGITPDRIIEIAEEDYKNGKDPQMEEALNYLKNL